MRMSYWARMRRTVRKRSRVAGSVVRHLRYKICRQSSANNPLTTNNPLTPYNPLVGYI